MSNTNPRYDSQKPFGGHQNSRPAEISIEGLDSMDGTDASSNPNFHKKVN
jgi:hypothetical protein